MDFVRVVKLVLPLYVLAGYLSGYRMAKRAAQEKTSYVRPGPVSRWGAMFMVVLMPVAAFSACYEEWSAPISLGELFGIMIGITMNLLFFYGGCTVLLTKSEALQTDSRRTH
jgi:hypothetical protein